MASRSKTSTHGQPKPAAAAGSGRTILYTWELGGGLGHLIRVLPLVRKFHEKGHQVFLAIRDLSQARALFGDLKVSYLQSPVKTAKRADRVPLPRNLTHILHNNGFADFGELSTLAEAWRHLYDYVRPDLILCDHSPLALVAARAVSARRATIGTGFCCPPDVDPLPDFRPWLPDASERLRADEDRVLADVNRLLQSWNEAPLERLSQLYSQVDECFLATFAELDHYPTRRDAQYWGAWPNTGGQSPAWPAGGGKKVFAYLKSFRALPSLLEVLNQRAVPSLVYIDRLDPKLRNRYQSPTLRFADRPLDLAEVGRQCDLAILNATHGATVSMLTAGKPILQIPLNLEQTLTGLAVERLGAGVSVQPIHPHQMAAKLTALLKSEPYSQDAGRFAAKYASFDAEQQIGRIGKRVEELLRAKEERPERETSPTTSCLPKQDAKESLLRPWVVLQQKPATATPTAPAAPRILVGIGSGRCGTRSLATLLSFQPSTVVLHESRPLLPWDPEHAPQSMRARFEALVGAYPGTSRVGDVAHFYLPYLEEILEAFPNARVICLKRSREETVESYVHWIAQTRSGSPIDHWRADRQGLLDDPWSGCYPKYAVYDMREGIRRYWDEYYHRAEQLQGEFPQQMQIFDMQDTLNNAKAVRGLLEWAGIPADLQKLARVRVHRRQARSSSGPSCP